MAKLLALLLIGCLVAALSSNAQPAPKSKPLKNIIAFRMPSYNSIGTYPGTAVGISYDRFIDRSGFYSLSISYQLAWYGTNHTGEISYNETRANIRTRSFIPGFMWHPGGFKAKVDLALGAEFPFGNIVRSDSYGYSYIGTRYNPGHDFFSAALAKANFNVPFNGPFDLDVSLAYGFPISAGRTTGHMFEFGIRFGKKF